MITFSGSMLDFRRQLLVEEAERLFHLQESGEEIGEHILRTITSMGKSSNWGLCFIQYCINNVDHLCERLFPKNYKKSDLVLDDKTLRFWQETDRRYRKLRALPGDLVVMHYVKQGKLLESGQLGIVTEVNSNLTVKTLEGGVVTHFDDEPITSQKDGIRERLRTSKGTAKIRVLGYMSPWMERG